jgi:hypothetical protein
MFKYTRHSLKKMEHLFQELDYTLRYEKGNFNSGYCVVEDRNMAVINKFFDTEGRLNVLVEILSSIVVEEDRLSEASRKFYRQINRTLTAEEEAAIAEEEAATGLTDEPEPTGEV